LTDINLGNLIRAAGDVGKNVMQNAVSETVVAAVRQVLNTSIRDVTPVQLLHAIREDQSLWAVAGGDIEKIAAHLPPSMIAAGRPMYRKALAEYGNATKLVLTWLSQDNPTLYSMVINTDKGLDWFDRQVREICEKLGLDYEVK
jgi:hypothetical protein